VGKPDPRFSSNTCSNQEEIYTRPPTPRQHQITRDPANARTVLLEAWVNGARHPRAHPALPITPTAIAADDVAGLATRIGLEDVLAPSLARSRVAAL